MPKVLALAIIALVVALNCSAPTPALARTPEPQAENRGWFESLTEIAPHQAIPRYKTSCIVPMSRRFVSGPANITDVAICVREPENEDPTDENPEILV